ncbi:UbiD family decarboxylase [Treponema primitia]|uniref:UbiD family decarboxylase n=1 Tax=Treponema primitia TaxID=88058 RepID=UPI00397FC149
MPKDFRIFLKEMEKYGGDEFVRIKKQVDPKFEATTLLRKLEMEGRKPMALFENPLDLYQKPSSMPLVMNAFSSRRKLAIAAGLDPAKFKNELSLRLKELYAGSRKPELVHKNAAPVKERVLLGDDVDLYKMPIPTHHLKDGGPFISGGSMITKSRKTGNFNAAMIRFHVQGPRTTAVHAEPHHHSGMIIREYINEGIEAPFAIVIGHHPSFFLGSQWEGGYGTDEYEIISGAMGEALRLVPSETLGEDFLVPADAEIVIEGYVLHDKKAVEGPLGEHTRYYKDIRGGQIFSHEDPLTRITAITMRKDAYFQSLFVGHAEHFLIGAIPKEAVIFDKVRQVAPGIQAVHMTPAGVGRYICYFSLKQQVAGEARDAIMAAFVCDQHIKYVIAVDEDVDIFNDSEVLWAVATRTQPDKSTFIIPGARGASLDPTVDSKRPVTAKMGIDATKPFGEPFPEVCEVPIDMLNKLRIEDYLN